MEQINIYNGLSCAADANNLADVLREYAWPKYFSLVDVTPNPDEENSWDVVCYCDSIPLLTVRMQQDTTISTKACMAVVTVQDGGGNKFTANLANKYSEKPGSYGSFFNAYVCKGGLAFTANPLAPAFLAITKDNDGNTVIVFNYASLMNSTPQLGVTVSASTKTNFYAVSAKSWYMLKLGKAVSAYYGQLTMLCPMPVADTVNYTPDLFYMPFTQYDEPGTYYIDGVHYLSNGLWCLRDE